MGQCPKFNRSFLFGKLYSSKTGVDNLNQLFTFQALEHYIKLTYFLKEFVEAVKMERLARLRGILEAEYIGKFKIV